MVNIESPQFIENVIDYFAEDQFNKNPNMSIDKFALSNMKQVISSFIPMIELKSDDYATSAIFDFSTSTFLSDIRDLNGGINTENILDAYSNPALYLSSNKNIGINALNPNNDLDFTNLLSFTDVSGESIIDESSSSDSKVFEPSYTLNSNDETQPIQLTNLRNEGDLIYSDIMIDPSIYGYESLSSFEIRVKSGQGLTLNEDSIMIDQLGYSMSNLTANNQLKSVWVSPLTKNSLEQGKIGELIFSVNNLNGIKNELILETNLVGGTNGDFESEESGLIENRFILSTSYSSAN